MNYAAAHEEMKEDMMYGYDDEAMIIICASAYGYSLTVEQASELLSYRKSISE